MLAGGKEVMPVSVSTAKVSLEPVVRQNSILWVAKIVFSCKINSLDRESTSLIRPMVL